MLIDTATTQPLHHSGGFYTMTGRERLQTALSHRQPDRPPIDLGSTPTSGAHVSVVYAMRQALGLGDADDRVKIIEPYQMLGEVTDDLREGLGHRLYDCLCR